MDNAGWHKSKTLIIPDNIKYIFLPPYSPELNPVERLWKWMEREVCHNMLFETLENISAAVCSTLSKLDYKISGTLCRCYYL